MVMMIDGPMINRFIDDVDSFRKCADDCFHELDGDGDGFLSPTDLRRRFFSSVEDEKEEEEIARNFDLIFSRFDVDGNGSIDREEFRPMLMEIFIAMARGIGSTPVNVGLDEDGLLVRVYEHDLGRNNRGLEGIIVDRKRNGSGWKKMLRKNSKKTLKMCGGCSGRCFWGEIV